jgi:hypothetical protein
LGVLLNYFCSIYSNLLFSKLLSIEIKILSLLMVNAYLKCNESGAAK